MDYISRNLEQALNHDLARRKSILLLGARQTGKTTLLNRLQTDLKISLVQPDVRLTYERDPSLLIKEVEAIAAQIKTVPLVVVDEIQKVPDLMDAVQDLIDRRIGQFILTGSSARKLRQGQKVNLLPGRVVVLQMDPLTLNELESVKPTLDDLLHYGSLPGILTLNNTQDKERDLNSYVISYLEEEIRSEALVRQVGTFSQFLRLAAAESGNTVNFSKLSQEIGIAHTTIAGYYQILEDCLIAHRVEPLVHTATRRKLIKSPKYLFFDLGVRRVCANEGIKMPESYQGKLFEQLIGLELIRQSHLLNDKCKVMYWRDTSGTEVDWVIERQGTYIPIEVKYSTTINNTDTKHLRRFCTDYSNVKSAYIVARVNRRQKLADNIYAIPYQELDIKDLFADK